MSAFCRTRNWITSTAAHRRTREAVRTRPAIRSTSSQGTRTTARARTPSDALVRRHSWLLGPIVLASTCRLGLTCFECSTSEHSKLERPARTLGIERRWQHSAHKVSIFRGTR
jgi:hypothetical protein